MVASAHQPLHLQLQLGEHQEEKYSSQSENESKLEAEKRIAL